jgi:hypothetical protein
MRAVRDRGHRLPRSNSLTTATSHSGRLSGHVQFWPLVKYLRVCLPIFVFGVVFLIFCALHFRLNTVESRLRFRTFAASGTLPNCFGHFALFHSH